jgi:sialidase-1
MRPKLSRRFRTLALVHGLSLMAMLTSSAFCADNLPAVKPVLRLKLLPPGPDNPRNSEAAFLRLKDGRIFMVYSRFTGKQGADESPRQTKSICGMLFFLATLSRL